MAICKSYWCRINNPLSGLGWRMKYDGLFGVKNDQD